MEMSVGTPNSRARICVRPIRAPYIPILVYARLFKHIVGVLKKPQMNAELKSRQNAEMPKHA
jgi:hypothetical protein